MCVSMRICKCHYTYMEIRRQHTGVDSYEKTQVISFGSKYFTPLSHLTGALLFSINKMEIVVSTPYKS